MEVGADVVVTTLEEVGAEPVTVVDVGGGMDVVAGTPAGVQEAPIKTTTKPKPPSDPRPMADEVRQPT